AVFSKIKWISSKVKSEIDIISLLYKRFFIIIQIFLVVLVFLRLIYPNIYNKIIDFFWSNLHEAKRASAFLFQTGSAGRHAPDHPGLIVYLIWAAQFRIRTGKKCYGRGFSCKRQMHRPCVISDK